MNVCVINKYRYCAHVKTWEWPSGNVARKVSRINFSLSLHRHCCFNFPVCSALINPKHDTWHRVETPCTQRAGSDVNRCYAQWTEHTVLVAAKDCRDYLGNQSQQGQAITHCSLLPLCTFTASSWSLSSHKKICCCSNVIHCTITHVVCHTHASLSPRLPSQTFMATVFSVA